MARNSHGTGTPGRMNEALGRDALGFIGRQTVQTQDFAEAIYAYPDGKQGHWVHLPHSETLFWVGDLTGGSTFEPGSIVFVASQSGKRGQKIIGRSPAGMASSSVTSIQSPPSVGPPPAIVPEGISTQGYYLGWSYCCDGGGYVWTACIHHRFRYSAGPVFVDGGYALRVARLSMADLVGGVDMPHDGYDIGDFSGENGGSEVFRLNEVAMTSLDDTYRTVSIIQSGGTIFVVTVPFSGTAYTVLLMSDAGALLGTDTFTGRAWADPLSALIQNSAICSNEDGNFYFAHPVGGGAEEFRFCRRSAVTGAIVAQMDIDFSLDSSVYAGIAPIPGGSGVRVFRNADDSSTQAYKDFDADFSPLSAWVTMGFGSDNHFTSGQRNMVAARSGGFAILGENVSLDAGVFRVDLDGDFVNELGDNADARPPIYLATAASYVFIGTAMAGDFALYRMLNDGTMA